MSSTYKCRNTVDHDDDDAFQICGLSLTGARPGSPASPMKKKAGGLAAYANSFVYEPPVNLYDTTDDHVRLCIKMVELAHLTTVLPAVPTSTYLREVRDFIQKRHGETISGITFHKDKVNAASALNPDMTLAQLGLKGAPLPVKLGGLEEDPGQGHDPQILEAANLPTVTLFYDCAPITFDCPLLLSVSTTLPRSAGSSPSGSPKAKPGDVPGRPQGSLPNSPKAGATPKSPLSPFGRAGSSTKLSSVAPTS
eukprot:jgi/Mesvir1/1944/Mv22963-RA.1